MRKFLIKLAVFAVLLFGIDRGIGAAMSYFSDHAIGGYTAHHNYMNDEMSKDVLIFGSSRAVHHYDSKMIEDSLGMTCYNCGQDGGGIILNYGEWLMIKEHCQPKMIIYDLEGAFDEYITEPNTKYLGWLKPYYDRKGIKEIFDDVDDTEKWKMNSMMYRHNSKILQVLSDYFYPVYAVDPYGFLPMNLQMDTMQVKKTRGKTPVEHKEDTLKMRYFEKFIESLGDTKLVIAVSPIWYGSTKGVNPPIWELCEKYQIPFISYANDERFVHNNDYFYNGTHLNAKGAEVFTEDFIKQICVILNNKSYYNVKTDVYNQ